MEEREIAAPSAGRKKAKKSRNYAAKV